MHRLFAYASVVDQREISRAMNDIEGKITTNDEVAPGYYLLKVKLSRPMDPFVPGQFVMIRVPDRDVFLRRPFSIYDYHRPVLSLLYKVVGKGTEILSKTGKNEKVSVLCPLGKGFYLQKRQEYVILSGGIGIAGVHALIRRLGTRSSVFFGCAAKKELALIKEIDTLPVSVSTLDGSYGFHGTVVDLLSEHLTTLREKDIEIFACGPAAMLKALRRILEKDKTPCQVLLEERMACGLGLCFGCVTKTVDEAEPYKRVCKEGPVFDLWEVCL
ncbi:MAG: Dihydroorotate dehydrogenase B (NAD(+)), electron transfer subunit [Syntrophorhabdus sp. PtaB.Bin006]|nr:MAG: Dihydroorotate dehydrogenase B (NAD(+)), electron transfer subunit [Syntrophorhabdus sp. PtaB.Bin006]